MALSYLSIILISSSLLGFMYGPQVLDKDGICAAAVMGELASYLYNQNMTVTGQLDALYQRFDNSLHFFCFQYLS